MTGFVGQYHTAIDDSGRLQIPSKLRQVVGEDGKALLSGQVVVTKGLEGCVSLFPAAEWSQLQARFDQLNFTQKDYRYFARRFYATAGLATLDKGGRIVVPAQLLAEARLEKEVLIVGVNRSIELWNEQLFSYYLQQFSGNYEEVAERLFSGEGNAHS